MRVTDLEGLRAELDAVRKELRRSKTAQRRRTFGMIAVLGVALVGTAAAQPGVSELIVFSANTPASASEVNANFALLQTWVERKVGTVGASCTDSSCAVVTTGPVTMTDDLTVTANADVRGQFEVTDEASYRTRIVDGRILTDDASTDYDVWIQGNSLSTAGGDSRNLAMLGLDEDSGDQLILNWRGEYAAGVRVESNLVADGTITVENPNADVAGTRRGFAVNGNDPFFIGLEKRGNGADDNDAIVEWADNSNDRLRFRSSQCCGGTSQDVMALSPNGNVSVTGNLTVGGSINSNNKRTLHRGDGPALDGHPARRHRRALRRHRRLPGDHLDVQLERAAAHRVPHEPLLLRQHHQPLARRERRHGGHDGQRLRRAHRDQLVLLLHRRSLPERLRQRPEHELRDPQLEPVHRRDLPGDAHRLTTSLCPRRVG